MMPTDFPDLYIDQINKLEEIIDKTYLRIVAEPSDDLFSNNVNFYTKLYLINLCAIAEACLKDIAMNVVVAMSDRLNAAKISHNIIAWSVYGEQFDDKKHSKFENFILSIKEKNISDKLSANPWRALKLFEMLGCDLKKNEDFNNVKSVVGSVVEKRNKIAHYNDSANDISLGDVKGYIPYFKTYMKCVYLVSLEIIG